jgi:hypothetical protein
MNSGEPIRPGKTMRWPRRRKNAYVRPVFRLRKASTYFKMLWAFAVCRSAIRPARRLLPRARAPSSNDYSADFAVVPTCLGPQRRLKNMQFSHFLCDIRNHRCRRLSHKRVPKPHQRRAPTLLAGCGAPVRQLNAVGCDTLGCNKMGVVFFASRRRLHREWRAPVRFVCRATQAERTAKKCPSRHLLTN